MAIKGEIEFETNDGEVQRLVPDMVVLAEDTTGKGHKVRGIGNEDEVFGIAETATSSS